MPPAHGDDVTDDRIRNRLRRLEGQVRGLQRMLDEERECADILTLLGGIRSALDATGDLILERHLLRCGAAMDEAEREDLLKAIRLARG